MNDLDRFVALKRQAEMPWDEPLPLNEFERPPFPIDAMPVLLREYSLAVAEQLQMLPDMPALQSLAAISTACAGKIAIEARAGWTEPIQTYTLVCMGVGERKSAAVKLACAPLIAWQTRKGEEMRGACEQSKSKRRMLERQLSKAEGKENGEEEALKLAEELASFADVTPPRLLLDDVTPEALSRIMSQNHGCASIWSAEGGFVSMLGGRYSKDGSANIDLVLKAHPGDTVFVDRVGRPSEAIKSPALTLMLSVQQDVLEELMSNKAFLQRGLCGRFLYSLPSSLVGKRNVRSKAVSADLAAEYARVVNCLLDMPYPEEKHLLTLSAEASAVFDGWGAEIEPLLAGEWQQIGGWANKLQGLTLRLAGQIHMAACRSCEIPISRKTLEAAIQIGRYAASHALAAFGSAGLDGSTLNARKVVEAIRKADMVDFSKHEIMRSVRTIKNAKEMDQVLAVLEEGGHVRMDILAREPGIGRPAGARWIVNPHVTNGGVANHDSI